MYTISEFRKNMRKAFNDSDSGHEVVIERYGQKYQLVSLVDKPHEGHAFESTPTELKPINFDTEVFDTFTKHEVTDQPIVAPENPHYVVAKEKMTKDWSRFNDGEVAEPTSAFPTKSANNVCKNGHLLQLGRNKCSSKGCKYA